MSMSKIRRLFINMGVIANGTHIEAEIDELEESVINEDAPIDAHEGDVDTNSGGRCMVYDQLDGKVTKREVYDVPTQSEKPQESQEEAPEDEEHEDEEHEDEEHDNHQDEIGELIKIEYRDGRRCVNARDMHEFLEVATRFNDWIVRRISQYDFTKNEDYTTFTENSVKGRPGIEYALTVDMAKELSMVENSEKGKMARRYFIEVEKRFKNGDQSQLNSMDHLKAVNKRLTAIDKAFNNSKKVAKEFGYDKIETLTYICQRVKDETGYDMLQDLKMPEPEPVKVDPFTLFINRKCRFSVNASVDRRFLYEAYTEWCDASGYRLLGRIVFGRLVGKLKGVTSVGPGTQLRNENGKPTRYFLGIEMQGGGD